MFCMAKLSSNANASVLVISPLNSIIEEQVNELNDLGLPSVQLKENDADCLKAFPEGNFRFIFCSAERCLSEKFKNLLKAEQTRPDIEIYGFRQNTDPRSTDPLTDPLLTPYKINGKMNTAYLSLNNPF